MILKQQQLAMDLQQNVAATCMPRPGRLCSIRLVTACQCPCCARHVPKLLCGQRQLQLQWLVHGGRTRRVKLQRPRQHQS